jgi:hypothetical protein
MEMSTRILPVGKGCSACEADSLTAICEPIVQKMWELTSHNLMGFHDLLKE